MTEQSKSQPDLRLKKPWAENQNNIWLASTIHLHRNIEKFLFPNKLPKEKRLQIVGLANKPLLNSRYLQNPTLIKPENISPTEKEYLVEHFLSDQNLHQTYAGEAFIVDPSGFFLATLNVNDHIQLELIDCAGELEASWNRMTKIEAEIGETIRYAFSSKFGFLTSDPAICGTALVLRAFLQPSALIHTKQFEPTIEKIKAEGITLCGIQGNPHEIIGDVYVASNGYTLGLTEENIISLLQLFVTKLLVEENGIRNRLRQNPDTELMDKVSRAFGTLMHSYKIETIEALNAISLIKLGADLMWVEGVSLQELNHLFFDCRRAHLLAKIDKEINQDEIPHKRAEFIHQALKNAKLKI